MSEDIPTVKDKSNKVNSGAAVNQYKSRQHFNTVKGITTELFGTDIAKLSKTSLGLLEKRKGSPGKTGVRIWRAQVKPPAVKSTFQGS